MSEKKESVSKAITRRDFLYRSADVRGFKEFQFWSFSYDEKAIE